MSEHMRYNLKVFFLKSNGRRRQQSTGDNEKMIDAEENMDKRKTIYLYDLTANGDIRIVITQVLLKG